MLKGASLVKNDYVCGLTKTTYMGRPYRFIDEDENQFFSGEFFRALDICCCSGMSSEGMMRTGAKVLGIDKTRPSFYPGTFKLMDALLLRPEYLRRFNFVWISPPCQLYSRGTAYAQQLGKKYDTILNEMIALLSESGVAGVIENIPESGIRPDFMLCGSMFGLPQQRHRHIMAINWKPVYKKLYCDHVVNRGKNHIVAGSFLGTIHDAAISMGCASTRLRSEIKEGVPPVYSEFVLNVFRSQFSL